MSDQIMEKVAEVAPKHYAFLVKTAEEIKTSPFSEDILSEMNGLVKKALSWNSFKSGLGSAGSAVGKGALGIAGATATAAVGGIALALAGDMYDAAKRGITKTRNYKNMMEANPYLRELPADNVQKAFSVLHKLNPEFSGEPSIAGAWVKKRALYGEDDLGDVNQLGPLIQSRKNLSDVRKLPQLPNTRNNMQDYDQKKELHPLNVAKAENDEIASHFKAQQARNGGGRTP